MKQIETNEDVSLKSLFQAANHRAAGWSGPVAGSWEPQESRREIWRFAVALIAGVLLVGSLARYLLAMDAPSPQAPAAVDSLKRDLATPALANLPTPQKLDVTSDPKGIRRVGGTFMIDLERTPIHEAIQMLAAETGFAVNGSESLQPQPITVRWQGTNAGGAWQQILGTRGSFSLVCPGGSCQVWIRGPASNELGGPGKTVPSVDEPPAENLQPEAMGETGSP